MVRPSVCRQLNTTRMSSPSQSARAPHPSALLNLGPMALALRELNGLEIVFDSFRALFPEPLLRSNGEQVYPVHTR